MTDSMTDLMTDFEQETMKRFNALTKTTSSRDMTSIFCSVIGVLQAREDKETLDLIFTVADEYKQRYKPTPDFK